MFDCHVHSKFSGDSDMPAEQACDIAIKNKLNGIAFTDHLDYDYPNYNEIFNIDFDKYSNFLDMIKLKYEGKLQVLKGIEVGIQSHVVEDNLKIVEGYDFDFVIGSVHVIDKMDPYYKDYYIGKTQEYAYRRYLEAIYTAICDYTNYDVVGHIGYVRRYGNYENNLMPFEKYQDILDEILKKAISSGKGLEVNTSGYRSGLGSPMPDYDIIKRYYELGGEVICLGSDAHFPEHIGHSFDITRDMLASIGFKYLTHFEKRKPVYVSI